MLNYSSIILYTNQNYDAETEMLMSKELSSTTKGKDAFEVLDNFFKQNEIDWKKLIGCTTDGTSSMLEPKSGFTTYVETVSSNATIIHCFIHRFTLSAKMLPEKMQLCLTQVIKLVNFVKTSAVNTPLNYFNFSEKRITNFRQLLKVRSFLQDWLIFPTFLEF